MAKQKTKILVIDDDPKVAWLLSEGLGARFEFVAARDGSEGLQMVSTEQPELILLDIKMPGMSGIEVLEKLNKLESRPEVIMVSGHGDTNYVVESIKLGAAEFINKPFDVQEIEIHINGVLERRNLRREVKELKSELQAQSAYANFLGDSVAMTKVKEIIEQVADSELTVLIRGESGTGKEIAARSLHQLSARKDRPFIKVNCAAIPRDLLEAELFGYEKGAFTGAHKTKQGRFEIAHKGTMFLDEIGDMPMELQSKLLQVLEQQEFVRVGGITSIHVDVRIICATNRNLEQAIHDKEFRDDLFYRLNEITLFLPPLRERPEDIPLLVRHFIDKYNQLYSKDFRELSPSTIDRLMTFSWPGNVRQLENMLKQVAVRGDESIIIDLINSAAAAPTMPSRSTYTPATTDVGPTNAAGTETYSLKERIGRTVAEEEKRLISEVLTRTNWNRRKAADLLEISYRSLLYKIKDYNLNSSK
ncbi:MAG TPA: sigma-54 dependent transcriptional regulator [candidate division Zixibacteria bacterium]|nr:sigma-54-dependent Fis family transcriptional regulator [candidate division Zixibacteria bacterium]MDD4916466.1 sigma-54 dependent transcriptional regulator [candidate division Zixibacteria bacterium]MDM7971863.1 sigma-54 dependent transcriptional regulator [candidate division Zixibacteria bacterium]HOD65109.1 sigma-54 dependent transcriptional regulator [candidate division Zixibacteria bacterium]HPM38714.1 sigma-54 dependent transcriptional regulator [candidate division Zixibacteria bacteri